MQSYVTIILNIIVIKYKGESYALFETEEDFRINCRL